VKLIVSSGVDYRSFVFLLDFSFDFFQSKQAKCEERIVSFTFASLVTLSFRSWVR
jgi:hypothetical protein